MIEAIDTWVKRKLLDSLKASPFFSILTDKRQDVSTQEEVPICFRCIVNECPEEHFMTLLHVKSTNAGTITKAITSYLQEKNLNCRNWWVKDVMGLQLSLAAEVEFNEG